MDENKPRETRCQRGYSGEPIEVEWSAYAVDPHYLHAKPFVRIMCSLSGDRKPGFPMFLTLSVDQAEYLAWALQESVKTAVDWSINGQPEEEKKPPGLF